MANDDFLNAEIQLHVASQILSLSGINFVPHAADDSHTTSKWDASTSSLIGREFELSGDTYRVSLNAPDFEIGLQKNGEYVQRLPLDGLSFEETRSRWQQWFVELGYKGEFVLELHYDLPSTGAYQFELFKKPAIDILEDWCTVRSRANDALSALTAAMNAAMNIESETNIWPHHFDTGTYYMIHQTETEVDRSIGAGLAVADSMVHEPYFYIYGWYKDQKIDYSDAPEMGAGSWIEGDWEGAVLPFSESSAVDAFFAQASSFLRRQLSGV